MEDLEVVAVVVAVVDVVAHSVDVKDLDTVFMTVDTDLMTVSVVAVASDQDHFSLDVDASP